MAIFHDPRKITLSDDTLLLQHLVVEKGVSFDELRLLKQVEEREISLFLSRLRTEGYELGNQTSPETIALPCPSDRTGLPHLTHLSNDP